MDRRPGQIKRLFAACVPHEEDVRRIAAWFDAKVAALRSSFRGDEAGIAEAMRISPPASWHLTLAFIGETDVAEVPAIAAAIRALPAFDFSLESPALGAFSSLKTARVLWVGGEERSGQLADLHERTSAALARWLEGERKSWHPHLTLARLRESTDLRALVREWSADFEPLPVRFGPIGLYESVQEGATRVYRRLNLDG
jgi:2'-5' RNA ligase